MRKGENCCRLSGKVALVTGSTKGVGRAAAIALAENGADVVINSRAPVAAAEILTQIQSMGRRVMFEQADITKYEEVEKMVANVLREMGQIDILVVSGAGPVPTGLFRELPRDAWQEIVNKLWFSRLYCIKAVLEHMIGRQWGKIILISTDAGRWPTPTISLSCGSGAAIVMMTKVLASEFARWEIRLNTICITILPGTPTFEFIMSSSPAVHMFEKALQRQPFRVCVEDLAEAVLFFASDASNSITGQILSINGGLSFPG